MADHILTVSIYNSNLFSLKYIRVFNITNIRKLSNNPIYFTQALKHNT